MGQAVSDIERDILKMAVVERHRATGNIGKGFITAFGLKLGLAGALIITTSWSSVWTRKMRAAVNAVIEMKGGLVVDGDRVLARLPLPVGGLMSEQPIETVRRDYSCPDCRRAAVGQFDA